MSSEQAGIVRFGAGAVAVLVALGAPRAGAEHVGAPDMGFDFTVSGAELTAVRDAAGNPTGQYTGRITGDTLSVSGTAHFVMGPHLVTYLALSVSVSAGGAHAEQNWPPEGGSKTIEGGESGVTIDQAFHVEIPVPEVAPTGSISVMWRNCGDWVCGGPSTGIALGGPKPLCAEAASLFGTASGQGSRLQYDADGLIAELQQALAADPGPVTISDSGVPPLDTAWKWLMPNGFAEDEAAIRRWSFTDFRRVDVSGIAAQQAPPPTAKTEDPRSFGLYSGTYAPPAGAGEATLARAVALAAQQRGHRLGPGEVLGLALGQTGGDARRAAMLTHNTLKALGRGGGERVTGLRQDPSFFENYLAPLRDDHSGSADDATRNAGEWYHLFGTMAFRLETIQGLNGVSDKIIRAGSTIGTYLTTLAAAASWELTVPLLALTEGSGYVSPRVRRIKELLAHLARQGLTPGQLGYSEWANWAEQLFREQIDDNPKAPDPEKYCVNVWGEALADALYRHVHADDPPPQIFDATRTNPWSDIAGDTMGLNGPSAAWDPTAPLPRLDGGAPPAPAEPPLRILGVQCPVDVVLEIDGRVAVLSQSLGLLVGDPGIPVLAAPEADGTYMLAAVTRADRPVKLSLFGAADGTARVAELDTASGRLTTWSEPVRKDAALTLDLPTPETDVAQALHRADGSVVASAQADLAGLPSPIARAAWALGTLAAAGAVLVVLAVLRRRRLRRAGRSGGPQAARRYGR